VNVYKRLWDWTCDPAHKIRSWVAHGLMLFLLMPVFGVLPPVFFYAAREVEQYAEARWLKGVKPDLEDAICDVAIPLLMVGAAYFLLLVYRWLFV
jgi:hypothetical protein